MKKAVMFSASEPIILGALGRYLDGVPDGLGGFGVARVGGRFIGIENAAVPAGDPARLVLETDVVGVPAQLIESIHPVLGQLIVMIAVGVLGQGAAVGALTVALEIGRRAPRAEQHLDVRIDGLGGFKELLGRVRSVLRTEYLVGGVVVRVIGVSEANDV